MINLNFLAAVAATAVLSMTATSNLLAQSSTKDDPPAKVKDAELGKTVNVHQCGNLFLAGQFGNDDLPQITNAGITRVITLRTNGEIDWNEKGALKKIGIDLIEVPFRKPDSLTDEVFDEIRKLLKDKKNTTLFHCGSANRVGGVWLPYRVLDEGVDVETATKEAKTIGLRNEAYLEKALDYIRRQQEK